MTRIFECLEDHPLLALLSYALIATVSAWSWRVHPALTGAFFGFVVASARFTLKERNAQTEIAAWTAAALLIGLAVAYGAPPEFRWEGMAS